VRCAAPRERNPGRQWKTLKFGPKNTLTLTGYSRAADRTFFYIPELRIGLDAGTCAGLQPEFVFITHSHIDHSKEVPWMALREQGVHIHCPEAVRHRMENFVRAEVELNSARDFDPSYMTDCHFVGVNPGDVVEFTKNYRVKVIECQHAVTCVGYCFDQLKKRLKPEHAKKTGKELGLLRKKGEVIEEEYWEPLFVFMGDTSIEVFERNPMLFDYPTIITECTFVPDASENLEQMLARCQRDGHIHWNQLEPYVLGHPKTTFILMHFSLRYKESELMQFFDGLTKREENPLNLDNVVLFITEYTNGRGKIKAKE